MDNKNRFQKILDRAIFLMSLRDHAEVELKRKLKQKFSEDTEIIENVIDELKRTDIINDERFARTYIHHRLATSPRGKKLIKMELAKKGINQDVASKIIEEIDFDEKEAAKKLALNKIKTFDKNLDKQKKKEKLMRFLASRGFEFDIILNIVKQYE